MHTQNHPFLQVSVSYILLTKKEIKREKIILLFPRIWKQIRAAISFLSEESRDIFSEGFRAACRMVHIHLRVFWQLLSPTILTDCWIQILVDGRQGMLWILKCCDEKWYYYLYLHLHCTSQTRWWGHVRDVNANWWSRQWKKAHIVSQGTTTNSV